MLALIDCDPLVYKVGFALQKTYWDVLEHNQDGEIVGSSSFLIKKEAKDYLLAQLAKGKLASIYPVGVSEPLSHVLQAFKTTIEGIIGGSGANDYKAFISGESNFRNALSTIKVYKGNRDKLHKPYYYDELRKYAIRSYGAQVSHNREADDDIAIEHSRTSGAETVVCSIDKDYLQLPGWNFNPNKGSTRFIEDEEARRNYWASVLSGDATDNIQGVYGLGLAGAKKILSKCSTDKEHYNTCLEIYKKAVAESPNKYNGLTPEQALHETASLLYLLRSENDSWKVPA